MSKQDEIIEEITVNYDFQVTLYVKMGPTDLYSYLEI